MLAPRTASPMAPSASPAAPVPPDSPASPAAPVPSAPPAAPVSPATPAAPVPPAPPATPAAPVSPASPAGGWRAAAEGWRAADHGPFTDAGPAGPGGWPSPSGGHSDAGPGDVGGVWPGQAGGPVGGGPGVWPGQRGGPVGDGPGAWSAQRGDPLAALVLMIRVRGLVSGPIPGVAALVPVARVLAALVLGRPVPADLDPRIGVARAIASARTAWVALVNRSTLPSRLALTELAIALAQAAGVTLSMRLVQARVATRPMVGLAGHPDGRQDPWAGHPSP